MIKYRFEDTYKTSSLTDYETVYLRKNNTAYICVPDKFSTIYDLRQIFEFADAVAELITAVLDVNEDKDFFRDLFRDNDFVREKKMRSDRGDDNLERLTEARRRFDFAADLRDEFWMAMAEVLHVPSIEITTLSADDIIAALELPKSIDAGVKYNDLSSSESIEALIPIFWELKTDIDQYNGKAVYIIDATKYWHDKLKAKMDEYLPKYQAYLINELKENDNWTELYDEYMDNYRYCEPVIKNSLFENIDVVFEKEMGVSFDTLVPYPADLVETEKSKIPPEEYSKLQERYSEQTIDAYLVFGKIEDLRSPKEKKPTEPPAGSAPEQMLNEMLKELAGKIVAAPAKGFSDISTQAVTDGVASGGSGKRGKHIKRVYTEGTDKKRQAVGMAGEACVYNELREDPDVKDVRWVSGNAELAGYILKGDDTCGYDIKYIDKNGDIQYVEVKASRNEEIVFSLSDNELRFGCEHAAFYEIIYVVIGEDGLPSGHPWRLGHLFEFADDEELLHNNKFSIESDSYRIVAKPVILQKQ